METAHESTLARLRAPVLIVMGLTTALTVTMSGVAHAAVTGTVVAWGRDNAGQATVPQGLRDIMAVSAGAYHTVALRSSYRFSGFVAPVNAAPIINTLKAGVAVPVTFGLGGNQGFAILARGYPAASRVVCNPDARTDEFEQTVAADHSSLSYDAPTNAYTYLWKTDPAWAGQCRRLTLRFADGIERSALFRFR